MLPNMMMLKEFLKTSEIGTNKLNQRYIKAVKSFISSSLIQKFWSNKVDNQIEKELDVDYNKRISPYEMANRLLK